MRACRKLIGILMFLVTAAIHAGVPAGLSGTLIVLNKGGDNASFIDLASGKIVATLPTGRGPHELVVSGDGRWAIGTDYGGGDSLTIFDIEKLQVDRTIDLSGHPRPHGILLMPGHEDVLVTSESNRTLMLVDFTNGEIKKTIRTGQRGSHMVALSADGSTAFTANGGSNSVSVIDLNEGRLLRTIEVPRRPEAITSNKGGSQIWVGSNDEGVVSVISAADGAIQAQWSGFEWPYRILLTKNEKYALVTDFRKHELRIFDPQSKTELAAIDLPAAGPQGMTMYPDDRTLFISSSAQDRILVMDIDSRQVIGEYRAGSSPDGIGFSSHVVP